MIHITIMGHSRRCSLSDRSSWLLGHKVAGHREVGLPFVQGEDLTVCTLTKQYEVSSFGKTPR